MFQTTKTTAPLKRLSTRRTTTPSAISCTLRILAHALESAWAVFYSVKLTVFGLHAKADPGWVGASSCPHAYVVVMS